MFGVARGKNELLNIWDGSNPYLVPCHLFDLTSTMNIQGSSITNSMPWVAPRFSNANDTGVLAWDKRVASEGQNWALTQSARTNLAGDSYPGAECTLDWVQAKILCYCPSALVCKWTIQIVQFKDMRIVPDETVTPFTTAFWQSVVKAYAFSPLESGSVNYRKYMRVLHSQSFIIEPKEDSEVGQLNHYRQINLFKRFGRNCRYDWGQSDPMNMNIEETQVNVGNQNLNTVHPRARIYLMIRAQSQNVATGSFDISRHPSYDIVLRKKQTQLAS